ncbi:MAG: MopE-related protein [Pseudomonadota bacterium]|nr:MopE-related protein [Pseudomonadota bacterium]
MLFVLLAACSPGQISLGDKDSGGVDTAPVLGDDDGDGFASLEMGGEDCDDLDPLVNPDATESWYDNIDQDCDNWSDFDQDRDGEDLTGFGPDCDDTDPAIRTTATETRDLSDEDCDGLVDETFIVSGAIVVSEVMQHPLAASDSEGEWFELQNTDTEAIDLKGWVIRGDDGDTITVARSLVVPAGEQVVLGASENTGLNGGIDVDYVYDRTTLSLSSEDTLFLSVDGATIFDIEWTAAWGTGDGASWSLDPDHDVVVDARQFDYWCLSTSALPSGDFGSPGATNDDCGKIDEDGDSYSADEGDCDDGDDGVSPRADDVWDGIDNDCSGATDDGDIDDITAGYVDGASANGSLSVHAGLGLGDVTGSGRPDLLVGGALQNSYSGAVYVIPGDDHTSLGGTVSSYDSASYSGSTYGYFGATSPLAGDNTGDGLPDFVAAGGGYPNGSDTAVVLFEGGSGVSGALDVDDAELVIVNSATAGAASGSNRVLTYLDMDGDGINEIVYSQPDATASTRYAAGRVSVFDAGSLSGEIDVDEAVLTIDGESTSDYLGFGLGGGDIDDDGYDDLYVGAPGADDNVTDGGAWYQVDGGTTWGGSLGIGSAEDRTIAGDITSGGIGFGAPAIADFDSDGDLDFAMGGMNTDTVAVFFSLDGLSGSLDAEDAQLQIEGDGPGRFGFSVVTGDLDGDGVADLVAGAPAVNSAYAQPTYWYYTPGNGTGRVYLFPGASLGEGEAEASDAAATVDGETNGDLFGSVFSGASDINGDGTDDLLVGAPRGGTSTAGRVYVVLGE